MNRATAARPLDRAFTILYPAAVYCCLCVLAFNVSTLFDKVIAGGMAVCFVALLFSGLRRRPGETRGALAEILASARGLYVAFALYLAWDAVLFLYTRDLSLAIRKFPYCAEYFFLFVGGVWYCRDRERLKRLLFTVAAAGSTVAAFSYFYHFLGRKPYYFQRMSTCRDYNVYASLLLVSLVCAVVLLLNVIRLVWWKRLLLLALVLAVNLPALYLAGSRRMMILLPWFYCFALLYEGIRCLRDRKTLARNLAMLLLCGAAYLGAASLAEPFAAYGEQKREAYNHWLAAQLPSEEPGGEGTGTPQESTIADILSTIENGTMSNKRKLIYASGLRELAGYSPVELLFGRGSAYDLYYYSHTQDQDLLSAYGYSATTPPAPGWMSAHNFLLADALNGGLIKLGLGLFLVGTVLFQLVRACRRMPGLGVLLTVPLVLAICNSCISGAFGLMNDVFFMTMLAVLGGVLRGASSGGSALTVGGGYDRTPCRKRAWNTRAK